MQLQVNQTEKILILGGNKAQIPLIEASRREGYFVVLCDYTTTNPGITFADKHYQEDFQNKDIVLEIAQKENIKGIISNSEAAMPIVAYVSEKLGLVGNTYESVKKLNSKMDFRDLQDELGVYAPKHYVSATFEEACEQAKLISYPIIMKPCKSSGSRGTTKIESYKMFLTLSDNWKKCSLFSLNRKVVIEEFVEMPDLDKVIDGDIFLYNGKFIWDGLFTSKRSPLEPMLPMTQTYPIILTAEEIEEVKKTVRKLLLGAGITFGEFNIELYFTKNDELFCIEINARQGGNGIPSMIKRHCGIDLYKLLVTTAMGHTDYFDRILTIGSEYKFVSRHPVYSHCMGIYKGLNISKVIKPFITQIQSFGLENQQIGRGKMAQDMLAMVDLEFPNRELQLKMVHDIENYIEPIVFTEKVIL